MDIYTAQYRYSGPDRVDITVKSSKPPESVLAPTWEMVNGYKSGNLDAWSYGIKYFALIINRLMTLDEKSRLSMDFLLNRPSITLVCFCPPQEFCHRILAARLLVELGKGTYHGERIL